LKSEHAERLSLRIDDGHAENLHADTAVRLALDRQRSIDEGGSGVDVEWNDKRGTAERSTARRDHGIDDQLIAAIRDRAAGVGDTTEQHAHMRSSLGRPQERPRVSSPATPAGTLRQRHG
jgi:hypothetical protein